MNNTITTTNLTKHYGDVKAVSNVDLTVGKGEIYGFLGLNGAGKTTTIRMLLGMIRPTSGAAFINGEKVHPNHNELLGKIGYLVETPHSYPNLTVRENLEIIRRLRFLPNKKSVDQIMEQLQLGPYANRKAKNLSLGNAQRLGLAKALIHHPEILILDEPTNGLDPAGIYEVRELLTQLATQEGVTIFISSHILGEISRFATRIGIIHQGKMVQELEANQLETLCKKHLRIKTKNIAKAHSVLVEKGYNNCVIENDLIKINNDLAIQQPDQIAKLLVNNGCALTLLQVDEENLESYFLRTINNEGGIK